MDMTTLKTQTAVGESSEETGSLQQLGGTNGSAESMASGDESGEEIGEQVDEDECERRRVICLADMRELELLFGKLKEALIQEKQMLIDQKLREIEEETAEEFTQPLFKMKQNMEVKIRLATILRDYRLKNVEHIYEYQEMGAKQSVVNDKTALFDRHSVKLESEIAHLEERQRQLTLDYKVCQLMQNNKAQSLNPSEESSLTNKINDDVAISEIAESSSGANLTTCDNLEQQHNNNQLRKSKRNNNNKKPQLINNNNSCNKSNGDKMEAIINRPHHQFFRQPDRNASYIVYSLRDYDILEDWSIINMHKRLNSQLNQQQSNTT